jgi:hypothetical protein
MGAAVNFFEAGESKAQTIVNIQCTRRAFIADKVS